MFISMVVVFTASIELCAGEFEAPKNRKASEILPPEMVSGLHYRVREKVVTYGYMHHYTVDSDYGVFKANGDGALRKRPTFSSTWLKSCSVIMTGFPASWKSGS